jgi:signal transduction histidine kinase
VLEGIAGERIRLALDLDAEGSVVMDRRSFRQVVLNLVANAREAMAGGGEIHIAARDEPGTSHRRFVHLTVADTGEGMDPETVARISEPFFTTRREAGHAGLGFATVHRIVNESGGTLGVDSAPGGGTSVHLRLPAAFDVSGLPDPARA